MPNATGAVDLSLKDLNEEEKTAVKKLAEERGEEVPAEDEDGPGYYTGFYVMFTGNDPFEVAIVPNLHPAELGEPMKDAEPRDIYHGLEIALDSMKVNRIVQTVMQAQMAQLNNLQQQQQAAQIQKEIAKKGGYRRAQR